jgi:hypothetical protein
MVFLFSHPSIPILNFPSLIFLFPLFISFLFHSCEFLLSPLGPCVCCRRACPYTCTDIMSTPCVLHCMLMCVLIVFECVVVCVSFLCVLCVVLCVLCVVLCVLCVVSFLCVLCVVCVVCVVLCVCVCCT